MKKNLFFLFAMLCSMSLFVACSDDDDEKMPELPVEPITPESGNLTVSINGTAATTGSAKFEVQNASEAILTLTNVIPGYASVAVDVELEAQTDGSYKFAGEAGLTTPPSMGTMLTKAVAPEPTIMTVAVQGTVTADGKASVTATTTLSEAAQGGVAGSWQVTNKVVYRTLKGEYGETEVITYSPLFINWDAVPQLSMLANVMGSMVVFNQLNEVTLSADGNITAQYWPDMDNAFDIETEWADNEEGSTCTMLPPSHSWLSSPKNLAFWYTNDGYFYVIPNISAILGQVSEDNSGTETDIDLSELTSLLGQLGQYGVDVNTLLTTFTTWMNTGIPLLYEQQGSTLKLYVDKPLAAPVIEALLPALPVLDPIVADLIANDPENGVLLQTLLGLIGIEKPSDLQTVWANTNVFEISLNFDNNQATRSLSASSAPVNNAKWQEAAELLKRLLKK